MNNIHLLLIRDVFTENSTTGKLYLNGDFECYTLEDKDRYLELYPEHKVLGKTCIPRGIYKVVLSISARFHKVLPEVLYVPNFKGVRIHSGNTAADTEGCILVGTTRDLDYIGHSRDAFNTLFGKLNKTIEGEDTQIVLEIK